MRGPEMPIDWEDRIANLTIHFGARTRPVRAVAPEIRRDLLAELQRLSPELFVEEMRDQPMALLASQGVHFAIGCSEYLDEGLAQMTTFLITTESYEFLMPRIVNRQQIGHYGGDRYLRGGFNATAVRWMNVVNDKLGTGANRAGKIYAYQFGPLSEDERQEALAHLTPNIPDPCAQANFRATYTREIADRPCNLVLELTSAQNQAILNAKVDINNRSMRAGLDPRDIQAIFDAADDIMPGWLFNILNGEGG